MHQGNLLRGHAIRLRKRGLSSRTCEKFKIYADGDTLRFHYYSRNGSLVAAKVRDQEKNFYIEGTQDGSFFGQHLFPSSGKRVVITEGELDAASLHECFPTWPHVSLPNGAAAAKKSCQKNLDWLQGYQEIVLLFDDDEPGREGAKEAASILPMGKVKIGTVQGYKDASDALQANDIQAIERAIWDAKPYRPDGIVDGKSLLTLITTPNHPKIMTTPSPDLTDFYMVSDMENLSLSLQDLVSESHRSAGSLQLHFYKTEKGSVIWLLKNQTAGLLWV